MTTNTLSLPFSILLPHGTRSHLGSEVEVTDSEPEARGEKSYTKEVPT